MFPYPSGRIHMGHVRNYAMGDVFARYKRAKGFNVLHPMGWDAFGMPAENAAMERKVHPGKWTYANIDAMQPASSSRWGCRSTGRARSPPATPSYYRHQQKLFLDMLQKGLAYRKSSKVNWDPVDHTVLANEQVIDGRGWRSGALVEQRELTQWFFKITQYSDELLDALHTLDELAGEGAPDAGQLDRPLGRLARSAGRSTEDGAQGHSTNSKIYTTRPDTLFGASFMAIAADHPLAKAAAAKRRRSSPSFCDECRRMGTSVADIESGREEGLRHRHPRRASVRARLAAARLRRQLRSDGLRHRRHLRLPGRRPARPRLRSQVSTFPSSRSSCRPAKTPRRSRSRIKAYDGDGTMINSRFLDGLDTKAAFEEAASRLEKQKLGGKPRAARKVNFRLRDWGISRQRYWGCPIPVVHCATCGVVPVPDKDLPIELPEDATFDKPGNPLERHPTWKHVDVPVVRQARARETDTMDTFVDMLLVLRPLHGARRADADR